MTRTRSFLSASFRARASIGFLGSILAASASHAQVSVVLEAEIDNTLYAQSGDLSNGAGYFLFIGHTAQSISRRALLRFDVSGIPAGSTIAAAELTVNMNQTMAGDELFHAHRALESWGEGASAAGGPEGQGGPAQSGDATWTHRQFPACTWTTPGGTLAPTPSGSVVIGNITGSYSFTGAGLAADVQSWIDGAAPNHGWVLAHESTTGNRTAKRLGSRTYPGVPDRPSLTVTYVAGAGGGAVNYCGPAVLNSSGCAATTWWSGSYTVADDDFTITANDLPAGQFGYFIASQNQGVVMPPSSSGVVCLGANIGRFDEPGQVVTGPSGAVTLGLGAFPTNPIVPVVPGDTWNFQCWYRDAGNTSNFSDGLQVTFD
ncbi:MAG: DNRLRE domain-containing protein [bacterium]|nr:DNRLRE domain-containing protein [bacterium]